MHFGQAKYKYLVEEEAFVDVEFYRDRGQTLGRAQMYDFLYTAF